MININILHLTTVYKDDLSGLSTCTVHTIGYKNVYFFEKIKSSHPEMHAKLKN